MKANTKKVKENRREKKSDGRDRGDNKEPVK